MVPRGRMAGTFCTPGRHLAGPCDTGGNMASYGPRQGQTRPGSVAGGRRSRRPEEGQRRGL